jgi:hypothetical protein
MAVHGMMTFRKIMGSPSRRPMTSARLDSPVQTIAPIGRANESCRVLHWIKASHVTGHCKLWDR